MSACSNSLHKFHCTHCELATYILGLIGRVRSTLRRLSLRGRLLLLLLLLLLRHGVILFDDVLGGSVQELPHVVGEGHLQSKEDTLIVLYNPSRLL